MWLKSISYHQLFVAFLLLYYNVIATSATNMAQLKNQQQALGQTSTTLTEHQQHSLHASSQAQQQQQQKHHLLQQQPLQSGGIAAYPDKIISSSANSATIESDASSSALPSSSPATLAQLPAAHYFVHEKETAVQEILKHFNKDIDLNDPYQTLNELKRQTHDNTNQALPSPPPLVASFSNNMAFPWNLYDRPYAPITLLPPQMSGLFSHNFNPFETISSPIPIMPRFLPIMSYPQAVYIPYPFIMSPEMFYPSYSSLPQLSNGYEDSMSRGAGSSRRPGSSQHSSSYSRNSPIFYVRLPPTPYMYLPSLRLGSTTSPMPGYLQSLSSFPSFSPIFNVPINFLANGKPSNIYQMSTPPNDMRNPVQFSNIPDSFNSRPLPPQPLNAYRPTASAHNYYNTQPSSASANYASYTGSSTASALSSSTPPDRDSKLTALKHPYFFNGRPEDIYILPNNFNPLYSSESSYY